MAQDFGWRFKTTEPVAAGDRTPPILAAGCDDSTCDLANADVAVGAIQLEKGKYTVATDGQGNISVKNLTNADWPAPSDIYVYAPSTIKADTPAEAHAAAHAALTDHEERIDSLEDEPPPVAVVEEEETRYPTKKGKK